MLVFNLRKCWYDAIQSGEKRIEYRSVKPYWEKRLAKLGDGSVVAFKNGYGYAAPTLYAHVVSIDKGACPYPGWDGEYFRIHFVLPDDYWPALDPTKYYPGLGVDDLNIGDYYEQKEFLQEAFLDDCEQSDDFD